MFIISKNSISFYYIYMSFDIYNKNTLTGVTIFLSDSHILCCWWIAFYMATGSTPVQVPHVCHTVVVGCAVTLAVLFTGHTCHVLYLATNYIVVTTFLRTWNKKALIKTYKTMLSKHIMYNRTIICTKRIQLNYKLNIASFDGIINKVNPGS